MQLMLIAPVWILVLAVIGGLCSLSAIVLLSWIALQRNSKTYVPDFTEMALDILREERIEQITKHGFSCDRDDRYRDDQLAVAAACYLYAPKYPFAVATGEKVPIQWPWPKLWKPQGGRMKQLQKGGGMLVAELERQLRKQWYELKKSEYATNKAQRVPDPKGQGKDIYPRGPGNNRFA